MLNIEMNKLVLMKKKIIFYLLLAAITITCKKESDDCHFFVTIKNNSNHEIIFSTPELLLDPNLCSLYDGNTSLIASKSSIKFRPYSHPDCIESVLRVENNIRPFVIADSDNYTTETIPCEEFEVRNTILRTYVLTLEDLERMDYTINYPEDASIVVD